eukprot:756973-Hanusia_phi.AAC.1
MGPRCNTCTPTPRCRPLDYPPCGCRTIDRSHCSAARPAARPGGPAGRSGWPRPGLSLPPPLSTVLRAGRGPRDSPGAPWPARACPASTVTLSQAGRASTDDH